MTTILALETATNACTAALQVGQKQYVRFEITPRQHARKLLPMIQSLLDEANIARTQIEAVAFGSGPGSFMGVRLAVGMAQGLAFGVNCPVIAVSTLQTIAQTAYQATQATNILAGWDARMGEIYWGAYQCDKVGIMQPQIEDQLSAPSQIDILSEIPYIAAGNAWFVYEDSLTQITLDQRFDCYPRSQAMLSIAQSKWQKGEMISPDAARPHYCRHHVAHTNPSSK